jgi:hypothetical protein
MMNKTIKNIFTETFASFIASFGSIVAIALFYSKYFESGSGESKKILLAMFAGILGLFISYIFLKIIKHKHEGNIFISYSHTDKKFVEKLVRNLQSKRFNILYDEEIINIGDNILDTISQTIVKSDVIILVISDNQKNNDFTNRELKIALESNKKIFPIILDENASVPVEIKTLKYADFSKDFDYNFRQLTKSLISTLNEKSSS